MDDPSIPVWHLLTSMLPRDSEANFRAPTQQQFVEAIGSSSQHVKRSGRCIELDARGFSDKVGLAGTLYVHVLFIS